MTTESDLKELISNCFIENQKRLYLTAVSITQNHFSAEDALQEAYLKIMKKYRQLNDVKFAKTWITRIVINQCKDMLKANKRIVAQNVQEDISCFENFDDEELRFYDMIRSLSLKDREIMILKYFDGHNLNEISMILKIPLSTVKSRLYRTLEKIKSEWSD